MPTALPQRPLPGAGPSGRRNTMLPLAGILAGRASATYAAWPVWKDSTTKEVKFHPVSRKQAARIFHDARRFERATRQPGRQDGAVTRNGILVLQAMLFDLINYASGRLFPSHAAIAKKACISERSVRRGLNALRQCGVVHWVRRCIEEMVDGRFQLRQQSNAYGVTPSSQWPGYALYHPPAPEPKAGTWGDHPPMAPAWELAAAAAPQGARAIMAELEADNGDPLAKALARLGRGLLCSLS